MSSQRPDEDILTTHSYDGIQEYDNPMPMWWKALFVITVIWAVLYVFAIEMGYMNTYEKDLAEEQASLDLIRSAQEAAAPTVDEAAIVAASKDAGILAVGEKAYNTNCAACHGPDGGGTIGPNLADNFWLHGGTPMDKYNVIVKGVAAKGMPAWGNVLGPDEQIAVSAFVHAMAGTTPKNPKAAQGDEVTQ